ncbi:MAG: adenylate/guanylate cyclase domain-containing protein [Marmoricola sp.]
MTEPEPGFTREQLEAAILGAAPDLTSDEVARASGFSVDDTRRFWRALGFADAGAQVAFTDGDVKALALIGALVEEGAVDEETVLRMTRAVGHTISRLAEWEVATLVGRVEQLEAGNQATGSRIGSALRLAELIGPSFEELLLYSWRRHLAAAVARVEALGANDENLRTAEVTIGFADLVGFSAYSNQHTQDEIGETVEVFENRCSDAVAQRRGRVIKTLGDSVLFVCGEAARAYDVAEDIVRQIGADHELPDVRVGLATGPVVLRLGDVFGPAVNLAARMTSVARRNRVIVDQRTAALLPVGDFVTRVLPARPVRGFGDVEPVAVRRR